MLHLYIDADGCPVKAEALQVAKRHGLAVTLVANTLVRVPLQDKVDVKVVSGGFDAADDWIAEQIERDDIVVTADIPLAARCLEKGAHALGPKGRAFTQETIGELLASRELMSELREMGIATGGPKPFGPRDRSNFLHELHQIIGRIQRGR